MGLSDYLMRRFSITQYVLSWERVACRNEFRGSQLEYGGHNPNMIPTTRFTTGLVENPKILWIHINVRGRLLLHLCAKFAHRKICLVLKLLI